MSFPTGNVAIFWDYENCELPFHADGYSVAGGIRDIAHKYGTVKAFKAYLETSEQTSAKSLGIRSELISCGVSIIDCPHNGRKNVADKMLIVDMLAYAMDNPAPATIILISGDGDFVPAVSLLRLRRYHVVIIAPTQNNMHLSMKHQASEVYDWCSDILPPSARPSEFPSHTRGGSGTSRASNTPSTINAARSLRSTAAPFFPTSPTLTRGDRGSRSQARPSPEPDQEEGPDRPVRIFDAVAAGLAFDSFYANISAPCTPQGTSSELRPDQSSNAAQGSLPTPPADSPSQSNESLTPPPSYQGGAASSTDTPAPTPLRNLPDPFTELSTTPTEGIPYRVSTSSHLLSTTSSVAGGRANFVNTEHRRSGSSSITSTTVATTAMYRLKDPPPKFEPLVKVMEKLRLQGTTRITSSQLGEDFKPSAYASGEITTLKKYTDAAESAGVVIIGEGQHGNRWIALHPSYHGKSRKSSGS